MHSLHALIVAILAVASVSDLTAAKEPSPPSLVGKYACTGENTLGDPYKADLQVDAKIDGFALTWTERGAVTARGIGFRHGGQLAVGYLGLAPDGATIVLYGVIVYDLPTADRLVGHWTAHDGRIGTETCQRQKGIVA